MLLYNTTTDAQLGLRAGFYYNDGEKWMLLLSSANEADARSGNLSMAGWSTTITQRLTNNDCTAHLWSH
jgi:hypothetical protein